MSLQPDPPPFEPVIPQAVPVARAATYSTALPAASAPSMPRASALFDVGCALFALAMGFAAGAVGQFFDWWQPGDAWFVPAHVLLNGGFALTATAALLWRRGESTAVLGLRPAPLGPTVGWGLAAIPACYMVNFGLALLYVLWLLQQGQPLESSFESKAELIEVVSRTPSLLILPVTLFVGVYEEILFRGLILARLRVAFGTVGAVLISSLLFGAVHLPTQGLFGVVQTGLIGLIFALLTLWRRSLWPAIVAHAVMDAGAFLAAGWLSEALKQLRTA